MKLEQTMEPIPVARELKAQPPSQSSYVSSTITVQPAQVTGASKP